MQGAAGTLFECICFRPSLPAEWRPESYERFTQGNHRNGTANPRIPRDSQERHYDCEPAAVGNFVRPCYCGRADLSPALCVTYAAAYPSRTRLAVHARTSPWLLHPWTWFL